MPADNKGRDTARLEAFSDGVFSIAITLLVLDIHVPHVQHGLLNALLSQWPTYLSYVISFVIIGIIWANHHAMFGYIRRTDHSLLLINTLFLMCVASIPFSTSLLAAYIQQSGRNPNLAAMVYSGILAVGGLFFNLIWWYATSYHRLIDEDVTPHLLQDLTKRYRVGPLLYLLGVVLAYFNIAASLTLYLLLAVLYALPGPKGKDEG